MWSGKNAEPCDLRTARDHRGSEASDIGGFLFIGVLACFLDDRDFSAFAADDGMHALRPVATSENDVGWAISQGRQLAQWDRWTCRIVERGAARSHFRPCLGLWTNHR